MTAGAPDFSLVVSTIGRPERLRRLFESVAVAPVDSQVVVVDQDPDARSEAVASEAWPFPVDYTRSARGLSHGRNVGMALARGGILAFPDDEAWYSEGSLSRALAYFRAHPAVDVLCGRQVDEQGRSSLLRFPPSARTVHRLNLERTVVSSSLFFRRRVVESVGGFDENLGAGSSGWWWAGEESDYVMRALRLGFSARYEPSVHVGHPEVDEDAGPDVMLKRLAYGCAAGEVYRRHGFPRWYVAWLMGRRAAKVALVAAAGRPAEARVLAQRLKGVSAGWRGRPPAALAGRVAAAVPASAEGP